MSTSPYPVHVGAELDTGLTRWLWLVKWLLAIPHFIVLAFLWLAFVVLSVVAMVAIVVTGRYPRGIFDFNVGVLRWTWRVAYYAYGALGTDKYPPFSLAERADYPAHLVVDYPEHLSRGLALVKWWLLAIPQYLVVGFFVGGGVWFGDQAGQDSWPGAGWGGGLIGLLVLVAAVVLAFTGRYPQPLPPADLRLRARSEPLGAPCGGVRGPDDRRLPALPAGPRRRRARRGPVVPGSAGIPGPGDPAAFHRGTHPNDRLAPTVDVVRGTHRRRRRQQLLAASRRRSGHGGNRRPRRRSPAAPGRVPDER